MGRRRFSQAWRDHRSRSLAAMASSNCFFICVMAFRASKVSKVEGKQGPWRAAAANAYSRSAGPAQPLTHALKGHGGAV